ncbi:MAG: M2 family metallopeptidase, partial [Holophagales bacterium]|nr:M2 family metallopeptidase [Holophagales bacterium]
MPVEPSPPSLPDSRIRRGGRKASIAPIALLTFVALALALGCEPADNGATSGGDADALQAEVQAFLDEYVAEFQKLYYEVNLAEWDSNTYIKEGDDTNAERTQAAQAALSSFTGSAELVEKTRAFLEQRDQLDEIQARQLDEILYRAANYPEAAAELVQQRIGAETKQNEDLYGFDFRIGDESVSTNDIDDILTSSSDLDERLEAWNASKEVGKVLKDGLADLVRLRNGTVRALGYDDYFHYQVSDYGMTVEEMMELNRRFIREVWPLYRELHTWARYTLAGQYGAEVPEMLPAHWLPNRWGQDWQAMVRVEGLDVDSVLAEKDAEWVVKEAEEFYVSLGFEALPPVFWEKSSLYPLPPGADYKKNNHASAWHLDLENDVRSLMSVQPNQRWWATTHHELGHIYYYMSYTRPEVPLLLRGGANRAFHEAVGTQLGIASLQKPFLVAKGLVPADARVDEIQALLAEALDTIVFIPFSSGTMTHFERDLYQGLPVDEYNQRWWQYGIRPTRIRKEQIK